jgi:hypothetical protein
MASGPRIAFPIIGSSFDPTPAAGATARAGRRGYASVKRLNELGASVGMLLP